MDHRLTCKRQNCKKKKKKLLEDNIVKDLGNFVFGKDFVDKTSKMWSMKENTDKLNLIKDKSSLQNINRMKTSGDWEEKCCKTI